MQGRTQSQNNVIDRILFFNIRPITLHCFGSAFANMLSSGESSKRIEHLSYSIAVNAIDVRLGAYA